MDTPPRVSAIAPIVGGLGAREGFWVQGCHGMGHAGRVVPGWNWATAAPHGGLSQTTVPSGLNLLSHSAAMVIFGVKF